MLEWMINFVIINNLVVGKDVKLDELIVVEVKKWFFIFFGIVIKVKVGSKIGSKISVRFLCFGICLGLSVVKRFGSSFIGLWRFFVGRFIMFVKGMSRKWKRDWGIVGWLNWRLSEWRGFLVVILWW